MSEQTPFYIEPELTAIAQAYHNPRMIADRVSPRVPVSKSVYAYNVYTKEQSFTVPDTLVGRKGNVSEVEMQSTQTTGKVPDHALDDAIPMQDYADAAGRNLDGEATEWLSSLIDIGREKRVADQVFSASNYGSSNKVTLAGNDQWNSGHADSDPIPDILTGLDACVMRPNIMVLGRAVASQLQRHSAIVKAIHGTGSDAGMVPLRAIADLFELEEVLIGEGWVNTAAKGQPASLSRLWGKYCALLYRDTLATTQRGVTFAFSPSIGGGKQASSYFDPKRGAKGSRVLRVADSVDEVVVANDLGYLISGAVS